ncbi:hypothetical protein TNCV_2132801 [Trichonephila clavipes]|nr:hypothetical protein TNCV_2132801 [Trichonephila clavipes]
MVRPPCPKMSSLKFGVERSQNVLSPMAFKDVASDRCKTSLLPDEFRGPPPDTVNWVACSLVRKGLDFGKEGGKVKLFGSEEWERVGSLLRKCP